MARIGGINVRDNSHAEIALTDIYGIGRVTAKKLCAAAGIEPTRKIRDLTEVELDKLRDQVKAHDEGEGDSGSGGRGGIEGNLRRKVAMDIKNKRDIKSYEGRRHMANLPLKARTKTNARTRKGPKKAIRK